MNRLWNVSPAMSAVCGGATQVSLLDLLDFVLPFLSSNFEFVLFFSSTRFLMR